MKNKIILGILFIITFVIVISCEKEDKWKDYQKFDSSYPLNGQYSVNWTLDGVEQSDPTILSVYNSSKYDGIWIDDNKHFWQFKVKANLNGSNFSIVKGFDEYWDDSTTISNGRIFGDSIYMELEWNSSPGDIYVCRGIRQTGFEH